MNKKHVQNVINQIQYNIAFQRNTLNEINDSRLRDSYGSWIARLQGEISGMKYAIRCLEEEIAVNGENS